VTGAGGFIGSAAVRALLAAGHAVRAHVGAPGDPMLPLPERVERVWADICDADSLQALTSGIDACVHLAGPAAVARSFTEPVEYTRAHVLGTTTLVHAASRAGVPRVVYVSSAEVYGRPERSPVDEDARLEPRSPYGAAKVAAETIVAAAVRANGLNSAIILRPFSVYGPQQRASSLLAAIARQAIEADAIELDDLRPVRDYCYVDDVALALVAACSLRMDGLEIVNIGSGRGVSVAEVASLAGRISGRDVPVRNRGATRPAAAEIHLLVADVRRAQNVLAWTAQTTLDEGLRRTLAALVPR
jgi:nucleoside-diphosphate-sugar epimerase